jgi:bacteriocin-like protein
LELTKKIINLKKIIMKDLTIKELQEINGGNPHYEAGVAVGQWLRKEVDNSGLIYALMIFCLL